MSKEIDQLLHDLEHQKMELIGVEKLTDEASSFMVRIMLQARLTELSGPQVVAVLGFAHDHLKEVLCSKCQEMADRIQNQLKLEFTEFKKEHSH